MSQITQFFFGRDQPALKSAVDFLCADFRGGILDLSRIMMVVPTRHASRRLREALAARVAEQGGAVLAGEICTPSDLVQSSSAISSVKDLTYWLKLLEMESDFSIKALLPKQDKESSFSSRVALAEKVMQLRQLLSDENRMISDVCAEFETLLHPELERWKDLQLLEEKYLQIHDALGTVDRCKSKIDAAKNPEISPSIEKVFVFFAPDLMPVAEAAIKSISEIVDVSVFIRAPESMKDGFSECGVPVPAFWQKQFFDLKDDHLVKAISPYEVAELIKDRVLLSDSAQRADMAIGVPDSDFLPLLKSELKALNVSTFDPSGESFAVHSLFHLIDRLGRLVESRTFEAFASLIRHPHFLSFLSEGTVLLKELDSYMQIHLPQIFEMRDRDNFPHLTLCFEKTTELLARFKGSSINDAMSGVLAEIYSERASSKDFADAASIVTDLLKSFEFLETSLSIKSVESISLFLRLLKKERLYEVRESDAVDLLGWAELAWEDSSMLLLAGMHEGSVPESVTGDMFLPDSARAELGLRDNRYLFARDVYQMHCLLSSRADGNCVFYISKTQRSGDPQKPSRLLFHCSDDDLASRALSLFGDCSSILEKENDAEDWPIVVPISGGDVPVLSKISATAFKEYLSCPFRFYLNRILKMGDVVEPRKIEMNAADFGNLIHRALEKFGKSDCKDSSDSEEIAGFLMEALEQDFRAIYGINFSAALIIQLDVAKQRLRAFAKIQAKLVEDGWRIICAEDRFENDAMFPGFKLTGVVDRVDRHEDGRLRVIDYKTFDAKKDPKKEHLRSAKESSPEWACTENGEVWTDLQLPIYAMLMRDKFATPVECGYFILPKAVADTGLYIWSDLDEYLVEARRCADEIAALIKAKCFWPPAEKIKHDRFSVFLSEGTAQISWKEIDQ